MKCPNCGGEIPSGSKFCTFCGSQITYEMRREQEQVNKQGCPKCGSSNVQFQRENQGEFRNANSRQVFNRTVGFCKDCGYTWYPNTGYTEPPKKRNTLLWVLGWLFFFPAPVMVLIWRKKNTWDVKVKLAVTVVFWILFLIIGLSGGGSDSSTKESIAPAVEVTTNNEKSEQASNDDKSNDEVVKQTTNKESTEVSGYDAIDRCYDELIANNTSSNWNELSKQIRDITKKYDLYQDSKNNGLGVRYAKIATTSDEAKVISNDDLDKGTYYIRIVADFSKGSPDIQLIDNRDSTGGQSADSEQLNQYSEDDKVNQFITEYNAVTRYEMTDFSKGNIKQKMFGHTNDCYVEMLNPASTSGYSFIVTINGGNNEEITEKMNEVFPDFIHTLDNNISDEQINEAITAFKDDPASRKGYKLGDDLTIDYYPLVFRDDGSWLASSRIDIYSLNYGN